jgi:hypothetical protein
LYYDSNKKLQKLVVEGDEIQFVYNKDGKLSKIVSTDGEYMLITRQNNKVTLQWYYDDVASDSKIVLTVNSNNEITRIDEYEDWGNGDGWEQYSYSVLTWKDGNVAKIEQYYNSAYWKKSSKVGNAAFSDKLKFNRKTLKLGNDAPIVKNSDSFTLSSTRTFTYDKKNNPFSIHPALAYLSEGFPLFMSKNNILTTTYKYENEQWSDTNKWEYNKQNYPTKLIMEDEDGSCSLTEELLMEYVNCD